MPHITYAMVRDGLPEVIAARGSHYTYEVPEGAQFTCRYAWEGCPSCMIGQYLNDLGFPLEGFDPVEGTDVEGLFRNGHMAKYGFTADPEAVYAMQKVQYLQDDGYAWGDCYARVFEDLN